MTSKILTSDWTGLSEHLIARFYPVDRQGFQVEWPKARPGEEKIYPEVHAPVTDIEMSADMHWQSPFETSGLDNKAPALTGMVQSGAIGSVMNALRDTFSIKDDSFGGLFAEENINGVADDLSGASGITKLNSTQIFSGMNPLKITMNVKFRAYYDAYQEVELPFRQLLEWALPQTLAPDGALPSLLRGDFTSAQGAIKTLLPSRTPQLIGFQYAQRTYAPMVIESINEPMDSPRESGGEYTELLIPMTISTLTALDKNDLATVLGSQGTTSDFQQWWQYE